MMLNIINARAGKTAVFLILLFALALWVVAPAVSAKDANESGLKIKTIKHDNKPTEEESARSLSDFTARQHKYNDGDVKKARVNSEIKVTVQSSTRASGGITVELLCLEPSAYVPYYHAVWGGSITKESSDWGFSESDVLYVENIDGCYFGVVDSTAEMDTMI
jgi:hypothetical protein